MGGGQRETPCARQCLFPRWATDRREWTDRADQTGLCEVCIPSAGRQAGRQVVGRYFVVERCSAGGQAVRCPQLRMEGQAVPGVWKLELVFILWVQCKVHVKRAREVSVPAGAIEAKES